MGIAEGGGIRGDIILKSNMVTVQAAETESYAVQINLLLQLHAPTNAGGAQHRAREESPFGTTPSNTTRRESAIVRIIPATF